VSSQESSQRVRFISGEPDHARDPIRVDSYSQYAFAVKCVFTVRSLLQSCADAA
jgi:hypothetical protein